MAESIEELGQLEASGPPSAPEGQVLADNDGTPDTAARSQDETSQDETLTLLQAATTSLAELSRLSEQYHARAAQREAVIDTLHKELERLRAGERRGLMRPLLIELCRLRADLLRQADTLPADFDAVRASALLRSFADTVLDTLEEGGIQDYAPEPGERFDPRRHRKAGVVPTDDPQQNGLVAAVARAGYLDVDLERPLAPAEVYVYVGPSVSVEEGPKNPSAAAEHPASADASVEGEAL